MLGSNFHQIPIVQQYQQLCNFRLDYSIISLFIDFESVHFIVSNKNLKFLYSIYQQVIRESILLLFPGAIYHPGRYKILSRVVYTTREGMKYSPGWYIPPGKVLIVFPSNQFLREIGGVFLLQIQVTRTNDSSLVLSKLISRNFDAIINMRILTVTY